MSEPIRRLVERAEPSIETTISHGEPLPGFCKRPPYESDGVFCLRSGSARPQLGWVALRFDEDHTSRATDGDRSERVPSRAAFRPERLQGRPVSLSPSLSSAAPSLYSAYRSSRSGDTQRIVASASSGSAFARAKLRALRASFT